MILPSYAFYKCSSQVGLIVFFTDDSSAERNALKLCWPREYVFYVLSIYSRYFEDGSPIMGFIFSFDATDTWKQYK
ncbi:hypothetical protein GLOIN_2v252347 [Rhizophagus irregularis DAOM 181602=DAOM 197198]|nr:hypothetical protein GLOIN_2v252347 [Rhizophagus irregularis DAOM 181602=DAOM 197198]